MDSLLRLSIPTMVTILWIPNAIHNMESNDWLIYTTICIYTINYKTIRVVLK
jgi:hypothetical protein